LNSAADFLTAFVDFGELRRGRDINLVLQAANARTGRPRSFTNRQITVEALLACSRLPQLAPPVRLGDDVYWDSRYCGLPAMEQLMMLATSPDLLVSQFSATGGRMVNQDMTEVALCATERALNQVLETDVSAFPRTLAKPQRAWAGPASDRDQFEVRIHQIRSTDVMADLAPSSRLDVRWATIAKLRDMGRLAAEIWLQGVPYGIGRESTLDHRVSAGMRPC
jgi:NTE family protein